MPTLNPSTLKYYGLSLCILAFFLPYQTFAQKKKYQPPQYTCKGPNCSPYQHKLHSRRKFGIFGPRVYIYEVPTSKHQNPKRIQTIAPNRPSILHTHGFQSYAPRTKSLSYKQLNKRKQRYAKRAYRRYRLIVKHKQNVDKHNLKPITQTPRSLQNMDKVTFPASPKSKHKNNLDKVTYSTRYPIKRRKNLDQVTLPSQYIIKHKKSLDQVTYPTPYTVKHRKNLDQINLPSQYTIKHKNNLDKVTYSTRYPIKRRKNLDQVTLPPQYTIKHKKSLDHVTYPALFSIKHRKNWDKFILPFPSPIRHYSLDKVFYSSQPKIRHNKKMDRVVYQPISPAKHRKSLDQKFLTAIPKPTHKKRKETSCKGYPIVQHVGNFDKVCNPPLPLPTRRINYEHFCYQSPKPPRRNNYNKVCTPTMPEIKHKSFEQLCQGSFPEIKHKRFERFCYEPYITQHKNFEKFRCYESPQPKHVPLNKYKVACDPNYHDRTSTLEVLDYRIRDFFTHKKKFCKLNAIYSPISAGMIVSTEKYGDVMVADYILKNHIQWLRFRKHPSDSTRFIVKKRKHKVIKHLVVLILHPKKPYDREGFVRFKKVRLSEEETKRILIEHYFRRGRIDWLLRMYPDERKNLEILKQRYHYRMKRIPEPITPEFLSPDEN